MTTGQGSRLPFVLAVLLAACSGHGASSPDVMTGGRASAAESGGSPSLGASGGASSEAAAGTDARGGSGESAASSEGGDANSSRGGSAASNGGSSAGTAGSSMNSGALGTPMEKALHKLPAARQEHSVAMGEIGRAHV